MSEKQRKTITTICFAIFILFMLAVCWFIGRPLVNFVSEPEQFREWVDDHGIYGRLAFIGMMLLQVFVAFIPGEPLEIGAGYAFGAVEGTLLCIAGVVLGSILVFIFVKKFGIKAVEVFFPAEKINSFGWFHNTTRLKPLLFLLFLIPGTPKDILTYISGLTSLTLTQFLIISVPARLPSIITSTIGGDALGIGNRLFAVIVFASTLAISAIGVMIYRKIKKAE